MSLGVQQPAGAGVERGRVVKDAHDGSRSQGSRCDRADDVAQSQVPGRIAGLRGLGSYLCSTAINREILVPSWFCFVTRWMGGRCSSQER